ncbi:hypothetical protein BX600DRAFT_173626 [Xylariales sp. PMI_506]|nr:hypothetical protein BX600DRAFT_173626 [Xylariales sp. PMI_506]
MMADRISQSWQIIPRGVPREEALWTRDRPPHLNDENFSSQADGPSSNPDEQLDLLNPGMVRDFENITLEDADAMKEYPPSLGTDHSDSTLTGDTVREHHHNSNAPRKHVFHYKLHDPLDLTRPALTAAALQAHDNIQATNGYFGNILSWRRDGNLFHDDAAADEAASMMLQHHPKSLVTNATSMSWNIIPNPAHFAHSSENVCGAGCCFDNTAAPPQMVLDDDDIMEVYPFPLNLLVWPLTLNFG